MSSIINPGRVDFVTLRLFCAAAQSGSITKGAKACNLALSAASRRLSDFEETAGLKLFERSSKGISLTPAGYMALQHALRLFQGFERFSSELRDYEHGILGHVRLWANMSALTEFLPAELARFGEQHPGIRVEVEDTLSCEIVRAVAEGIADLGIFSGNTPSHGLDVALFRSDELVVLCAKNHTLARTRKRRIAFRDCLAYDIVGLERGSALLELTSREAEQAGIPMRLRIQLRSFEGVCRMVAANLGVGVAPLAACKAQAQALGLTVIRLTDHWARRKLMIGKKRGVVPSPSANVLLHHLLPPEADGAFEQTQPACNPGRLTTA